jgi:CubicO group peptidase (beta-lactamase class C family)
VAEEVTSRSWEDLVRTKIFEPLQMSRTGFELPADDDVTLSYHENGLRELERSWRFATQLTAPAGGSIHSTVRDMTRWIELNLKGGRPLIASRTLAEIHAPQMVVPPSEAPELGPNVTYAMGWFVDAYGGFLRLSHGGYLHDVSSEVTLVPQRGIGIVSFTNFGFPSISKLINEAVLGLMLNHPAARTVEEKLVRYERRVLENKERIAAVRRVANTSPPHALDNYAGTYVHPGYGPVEIYRSGDELVFRRNRLSLRLEHWHYEAWVARDPGIFFIHVPHAFDRASLFLFETNAAGEVAAVTLRLEPAVAPIRFARHSSVPSPTQ